MSQHLSALTKDEVTAPYVNLMPQEMPGDLYTYAAKFVWEHIESEVAKHSREEREKFEELIDKVSELRQDYLSAKQGTEDKKRTWTIYTNFKNKHKEDIAKASVFYWNRFTDNKERRKLLKRKTLRF